MMGPHRPIQPWRGCARSAPLTDLIRLERHGATVAAQVVDDELAVVRTIIRRNEAVHQEPVRRIADRLHQHEPDRITRRVLSQQSRSEIDEDRLASPLQLSGSHGRWLRIVRRAASQTMDHGLVPVSLSKGLRRRRSCRVDSPGNSAPRRAEISFASTWRSIESRSRSRNLNVSISSPGSECPIPLDRTNSEGGHF